jgi:acyl-CoA thioester hydrolase
MSSKDTEARSRTPSSAPIECGLAVVHPWLCDVMGHLSTRNYMAMFDDATYQFLSIIGYDARMASEQHWGWADVRHEINYISEIAAGAVLRVEGRAKAYVCATLEAKIVCFDLEARRARPPPPYIADAFSALLDAGSQAA